MKKTITILSAVVLLLASCGNEKTAKKLEQKEDYRYVEIEECTIPIPKKYDMTNHGNEEPYLHNYVYEEKRHILNKQYLITVKKRYEDDYINMKEFIAQGRNRTIVSETTRDNFQILESTIYDDTMYYMYGKKSVIGLMPSNKAELNYLLDYCKKTWKLNKGEK
jgi:hypothetical protein